MTSERCRFFRNKSMCVSGRMETDEENEESGAAAYCWCNHTMTEIGEDDHLVNAAACSNPARACYQPL